MKQGDIVYANTLTAVNRPGPKPELSMTWKAPKPKAFVFLCLGTIDRPLTSTELAEVLRSFGYVQEKELRSLGYVHVDTLDEPDDRGQAPGN